MYVCVWEEGVDGYSWNDYKNQSYDLFITDKGMAIREGGRGKRRVGGVVLVSTL